MTLSAGTKLGPYEIIALLGAGGMGEVYRARDPRLGREVAIKVLPQAFSADADRVARFRREAKVLASLNHPHIAAIYGVEESGGVESLVLELVEGETLAERIARSPVSVDETLGIASQIAEALGAAHERGIVHRDLKPGNVMVTVDGKVKVLDFGLARALLGDSSSSSSTQSPTVTTATQAGAVMGTAAYLSPEQARGASVDKRSDIWAFGAVLYETLTGRKAFPGESLSDVLAAVLTKDPDWVALPAATPGPVRRVLKRCLERDRNLRFHDIADARIELLEPGEPLPAAARGRAPWWLLIAAALGAAGAAALALRGTRTPGELPLRKLQIAAPRLDFDAASPLALSPDGARIAYVADGRLWIRDLRQLAAREVSGSAGAAGPFWSPDGAFVGFESEKKLWKVPAAGGDRIAVAELADALGRAGGAVWTSDDRIAFSLGFTGLLQAPAAGGKATPLLSIDPKTEGDFHTPGILDGKGILFVVHRSPQGPDTIAVFAGTVRKVVLQLPGEHLWNPVYSPSGHLLFRRDAPYQGLWAAAFSLSKLEVLGKPFLVAQDARFPSVASDGTLAFARGPFETLTQIVWRDRTGRELETVGAPGFFAPMPALSSDGRRLAIPLTQNERTGLWIVDLDRGTGRLLSSDAVAPTMPVWSPSGEEIAYQTGEDQDSLSVWVRPADGSGEARLLAHGMGGAFTPDGKFLVYSAWRGKEKGFSLASVRADGSGSPLSLPLEQGIQAEPSVSPDGRYVAYSSWMEAGRSEIEIRSLPSGEGRWQVSSNGGRAPRWSRRGDELFYAHDNDIMAVDVKTTPALLLGPPHKLFALEPSGAKSVWFGISLEGFDLSQDARRFLTLRNIGGGEAGRAITIVQNWFAEFRGKSSP